MDGRLTEQGIICPYGQYSNVTDADGNVYVADGEIFVYDKSGKEQRRIQIEERPISLAIGGRQKDMLLLPPQVLSMELRYVRYCIGKKN